MEYLSLKFKSAKFYPNTKGNFNSWGVQNGKLAKKSPILDGGTFKEPITVKQISNVLHVLCGRRPVPSLRVVEGYDPIDQTLYDIANNSIIKHSYQGVLKQYETSNGYKAHWRSKMKGLQLKWFIIEETLPESYAPFILLLTEILGFNPLNHTCAEVRNMISQNQKLKEQFLTGVGNIEGAITPIVNYFSGKKDDGATELSEKETRCRYRNTKYVNDPSILEGEIIVPLTDYLRENINSTSCTILENGFVYIDKILKERELKTKGFQKVSDISLERTDKIYIRDLDMYFSNKDEIKAHYETLKKKK